MATGQREYETTLITKPDLDEHVASGLANKLEEIIKSNNGSIIEITEAGKKKLAYPIKKHSKGNYLQYHFTADPKTIRELERQMNISEEVLRFYTTRLEAGSMPKKQTAEEVSKEEE